MGRGNLAVRLMGPDSSVALRQAVRRGDRVEARRIADLLTARGRPPRTSEYDLLLLMEGRYGQAGEAAVSMESQTGHRSASIRSAAAYLAGDCERAREAAFWLLNPADQETANLKGEAGATGLGALQRVAEKVRIEVSFALGLVILGDGEGAAAAWKRAEAMAAAGGIPGLLDQDEQILRLLNPGVLAEAKASRARRPGASKQPGSGALY
jgi:hypothetical protein